ncbi:hypothetical protein ABEB22_21145 (plasmid) [Thioclava sp. 'Guangxiensis']|uniref:hypothetical protein n=1 Tax=Thioclava sp. 'Guangxiensis' TaxID=3149044 RepID=UPI0032C3D694
MVIISHWEGHGLKPLRRLLASMGRLRPDTPARRLTYDLLVVSNGGNLQPADLECPAGARSLHLLNRENAGYNIGAWDAGLRAAPGYHAYLLVQDECFIRRAGWLEAFRFRLEEDPGMGLVGESMNWDGLGWDYLKPATARDFGNHAVGADRPASPIDAYIARLAEWGVARAPTASHLQSLVLYVSGALVERLGRLQTGNSYSEAVTGEIAISQRAMMYGYRIGLVRPGQPFHAIGHPQWVGLGPWKVRMNRRLRRIKAPLKRLLGR